MYVQLYDVLREQQGPSFYDKVKAIDGDMLEDRLGLSDEDRQMLEDEVNIVLHSAATVKFDEHLRWALAKVNIVTFLIGCFFSKPILGIH